MGVCRGCELGKPLAKPHPSKDVMYRATKKIELVHADLAGPMRQLGEVLIIFSFLSMIFLASHG